MSSLSEFEHPGGDFVSGPENLISPASPLKQTAVTQLQKASPLQPSQRINRMNEAGDQPTKWEHIRELDDDEKWYERTQVVTKQEHKFYLTCAQEILEDIVCNVTDVVQIPPEKQVEKGSEYSYMDNYADEDFSKPDSNFDVDYLERQTGTASSFQESAFARQSLYVKFDPLIHAATPEQPPPQPRRALERNNLVDDLLALNTPPPMTTARKVPKVHFASEEECVASNEARGTEVEDTTVEMSVDVSGSQPVMPCTSDEELVKVLQFSERDVQKIVEDKLAEERAKNELLLMKLDAEHKKQLQAVREEKESLRSQCALVVGEREHLQSQIKEWKTLSTEAEKSPLVMADKNEAMKAKLDQIQKQRDQALSDYEVLEKSYAEFHSRYFKIKDVSQAMKQRESSLKDQVSTLTAQVKEGERLMSALNEEMKIKQDEINTKVHRMQERQVSEVTVLKTEMKKMTLDLDSLRKALEQKEQEKVEMSSICDELVKELGKR